MNLPRSTLWDREFYKNMFINNLNCSLAGLKVNKQLVAYATRFSAVRLKNHVWSYHHALKAKVQCNLSSAYSPDHSNALRLINIINIRYSITRHKIHVRKSHHFLCVLFIIFKPNFPLDSPNSNVIFLHVL